MRLIILGPPGSGKGTQSKLLAEKLHIPAISVGQLLRNEVKEKTPEGETAKNYMERGAWVPHEVTFKVLSKRLSESDCKRGFVLDAFPRLSAEYHQLGMYFAEKDWKLDAVINLKVSDLECLRRIQARAAVQESKGIFRPDTSDEVTLVRLSLHHKTAKSILEYYDRAGLLIEINGENPVKMVHNRIIKTLGLDFA